MAERRVVTCFLMHQGKLLVLRRSAKVRTYQGKWAGVSGYIEDIPARDQAWREIWEEVGLLAQEVELSREGKPLRVRDPGTRTSWVIYPFLFEVKQPERIRLDWENSEYRWIDPEELSRLDTVPKLAEAFEQLNKGSAKVHSQ